MYFMPDAEELPHSSAFLRFHHPTEIRHPFQSRHLPLPSPALGRKLQQIFPRKQMLSCQCVVDAVVQSLSHAWLFVTPWTAVNQASPSFTISWSLLRFMSTQWCHPTISSSVIPFSPCPQSFPASGSFPMSWLFASGSQSVGTSALASVIPMNIQDWFPLGLTGRISLQSKGLSRVFSSTTVQGCQFFSTQPSLWSNSHIHTWLLEKP